jgi:hypothetical protein
MIGNVGAINRPSDVYSASERSPYKIHFGPQESGRTRDKLADVLIDPRSFLTDYLLWRYSGDWAPLPLYIFTSLHLGGEGYES